MPAPSPNLPIRFMQGDKVQKEKDSKNRNQATLLVRSMMN